MFKGVVASVATAGLALLSAPPALAAPTDDSEALGQVINADALGLDAADLGTSQSGNPSDPGPYANPLNVAALETVNLDLGSISLPLISDAEGSGLLYLGEAGTLSSYATSPSPNSSTASAGVLGEDGALTVDPGGVGEFGSAEVNLTQLLGQAGVDGLTDDIIDELTLQLGAVGSTATADGTDVSSEYMVADGRLVLSSPAVGALATELDTALDGVGTTIDSAVSTEGALGAIAATANLDADLAGLLALDAGGGTIGVDGLQAALDEAGTTLLSEPLVDANELVSINLAEGTIAVDLQALGGPEGLNGQDPNTELLSSETIMEITGAVSEALGTITTKAGEAVTEVLNNAALTIEVPASVTSAGVPLVDVSILVETTLGQLAGTTEGDPTIDIQGSLGGVISLDALLGALDPIVQSALITPLQGVVGGVLDTATSGLTTTLNGVVNPVVDSLSPVLSGVLAQVVSITLNEQPEPGLLGAESFTVNALSLELLPNADAVDLNLGSSTVRAADAAAVDPTVSVTPGTVEDGGVTTVTGENYPPNTDVAVQLTDLDGNPIGEPVPVTTDDTGSFTTDLTVPEGTEAGDYLVEGTATSGETATAPLAVTNADEPTDDNTADNTEVNTSVNTADNTSVNTADNTGENTSVNTSDNTSVNTSVNTTDNTSVNTGDNTSVNTADNTGDNTSVNAADNTADNTDVNTTENDADNTEVNTADNTDVNTAENDADNTEVNTADNTGDNTADNTATAELDVTPKRAVQGVDTVLVHGSGYTPNGTADIFLRPMDGDVINEEEAAEVEPMVELANQGFTTLALANPGENIGTVDVDADGELVFRIATDDIELGDYAVTAIDQTDPELEAYELFTLVAADAPAEDPAISVDPSTVNDGESTTVTGENFPPNTEVEVQLTDPEGNPVGDPVTVTTDDDGGFTAEITVPEGSAPGDYEIVAEAETGESATVTLPVTDGSGADNGAANGGDNTADNGGDNTADDAGDNGADNTSANTGGSGTPGGWGGNGSGGSYDGGTSGNGGGGSLAQTGAAGTAAMAGLAALLLLAGSAALITRRRAGR
ncbi:choice-of-anchor G family protein [Brachybacterium sp. GCM10030252]|uniref:choice-of-anchor G family protein n=1 Tax=Brachybacterium sp. GCM10030252 TaxID=3273380 RepID=UPI0036136599